MFNPRPSSGISHNFSKSSSKLDTINRTDSQNSTNLDHITNQNNQEPTTFNSNKYRSDHINLVKRNDDIFRDKSKVIKNVLDFDSTYTADTNMDTLFGSDTALEMSNEGIFEKNYLLRLMFTFERMSKMGNRKFISEPLHFHSVDVTSTYNKEQEQYYDKDKMKKMLYKQSLPKRTFFDNQSRLIKGVRGLDLKGVYREEDMAHENTEGDKAFEVFDMRKISESVKFKEVFNNSYNKDPSREYRQGLNSDLVRQFTRENSSYTRDNSNNFTRDNGNNYTRDNNNSSGDLSRTFSVNREESTELTRTFGGNRDPSASDLNKFARDTGSAGDLNRLFTRDNSSYTRDNGNTFTRDSSNNFTRDNGNNYTRDNSNSSGDLSRTFSVSRDEGTNEVGRHFSGETTGDLSRTFGSNREHSPSSLNKHMSRDQSTSELSRHMSREAFRESFKNVQQSWDEQYQTKQPYMNTNNMVMPSNYSNTYKDYTNSLSQSKDLLKESFESTSFYKESATRDNNKEDTDQSFLERLLDKQLDNTEAVETAEANLNFNQNYMDAPRKMWNEVNLKWQYMDPQGMVHGPFSSEQMCHWYLKNFFPQNLRMRYSTKMAWVPFKDLFPTNSVPFKSLPKQFGSSGLPGQTTTPGVSAVNMGSSNSLTSTPMPIAVNDGWTQSTTNNLLASPNSSFSNNTNGSSTNLLAPSNLLNSNTSLLGPTSATTSLLGGSSASSTSLLAPSNLLGTNSLLNPASNPNSLLGSDSGSPGLLGHSSNATSLLGQASSATTTASLLGPTTNTASLLGSSTSTQSLLGTSTSNSTSSVGLLNNRLENLWNNSQSTVHPISSMSNIHMGVSNMPMSSIQPAGRNHLNKQMSSSSNHLPHAQGFNKQMSASSGHLAKQMQPSSSSNHLTQTQGLNKFTRDAGSATAATNSTVTPMPKDYTSSLSQSKQYSASPSTLPQTKPAQPAVTSASTAPPRPAPPTNERKWNAPQVEVSSLFEIMELEKKSAKERVLKSPPPKPVQTGWNLSNVTSNNLSESDDFPSLSTVTTASSNSNTATASAGKKFGKHITMPLETFIEKHPLTSPPQLTETFSSKLLGNKH